MEGVRLASQFFSSFRIEPTLQGQLILSGEDQQIIVKTIVTEQEEMNSINQILQKHVGLDQKYIIPLLYYEKVNEGFRCYYTWTKNTLDEDICNRQVEQEYYSEEDLWIILDSLVQSFIYLQRRDIVYGVLSLSKIVLTPIVRLLDPSAFNIKPLTLSRMTLHSPQLEEDHDEIDFWASDIFLLGMCFLQIATLTSQQIKFEEIQQKLAQISSRYSQNIVHVLSFMLELLPTERPSFKDIKEYIESQIQIRQTTQWPAEPLAPDEEDRPSLEPADAESDIALQDNSDRKMMIDDQVNDLTKLKSIFMCQAQTKRSLFEPNTTCCSQQSKKQLQDIIRKKLVQNKCVSEFKLQPPQTVHRKKLSRAHQIKSKKTETLKTLQSVPLRRDQAYNCRKLSIVEKSMYNI